MDPTNDDLAWAIGTGKYPDEAGNILFAKNPANRHLLTIMRYAKHLSRQAATLVLDNAPENHELDQIIFWCQRSDLDYLAKRAETLLKRDKAAIMDEMVAIE
jgi:hypothetical protein